MANNFLDNLINSVEFKALMHTAVIPSLPRDEQAECRDLMKGCDHIRIQKRPTQNRIDMYLGHWRGREWGVPPGVFYKLGGNRAEKLIELVIHHVTVSSNDGCSILERLQADIHFKPKHRAYEDIDAVNYFRHCGWGLAASHEDGFVFYVNLPRVNFASTLFRCPLTPKPYSGNELRMFKEFVS